MFAGVEVHGGVDGMFCSLSSSKNELRGVSMFSEIDDSRSGNDDIPSTTAPVDLAFFFGGGLVSASSTSHNCLHASFRIL